MRMITICSSGTGTDLKQRWMYSGYNGLAPEVMENDIDSFEEAATGTKVEKSMSPEIQPKSKKEQINELLDQLNSLHDGE